MRPLSCASLFLAALLACADGPSAPAIEETFSIPREIRLDGVLFSAELDARFLPPATPTAPFYHLIWVARNTSSRTITLDFCWLGIRLYRGSEIIYEDPSFGHCLVSESEARAPGGEWSIGSAGDPDLFLRQGVPQGRSMLTVRWYLPGMRDTLEIRAGEVELIENNGLPPAERPGTETRLFVSGRSHSKPGEPVRGFVNIGVHWGDCGRFPVAQETTFTDVTGHFQKELILHEGIFDACISVEVIPYDEARAARTLDLGGLTLREPASSGSPRDSLTGEVVFE